MQYVFESTDGDGCIRCYVAEALRREADMLIVRRKGLETAILISSITDWCTVDGADEDAPMPLDMRQMAA